MKLILFLFVTFLYIFYGKCLLPEELVVETNFGKIRGTERDHFTAFEGIPYAEAPVGELRFEPPIPFHTKWDSVRDASKPGRTCLQWNHFQLDHFDKLTGAEDCLYLNIYTPKNVSKSEKIPIIFHIHGGALMFGNGDFYGPEFITTRPLILVNFNYRLGPLGFISTGCHLIPGNMGMKDQVAALTWVKENIEAFGGDPSKITITGFSAGGASVHLHTMSDLSKGLFRNAISHSGTAFDPWVMQRNAGDKFTKVAHLVGCGDEKGRKGKVACLKGKSAEDIVRTVKQFQSWLYNPFQIFGVVIEPELENVGLETSHDGIHEGEENALHHHHHFHTKPFLSDTPENLIKNHHVNGDAWLVSETKDEGLYPAAEFLRKPEYLTHLNEHWNQLAPLILMYNETIPANELDQVSQKIRKHYLGDDPINEEHFKRFVDILTDRLFHLGLDHAARLQGKEMPTYVYYFNSKLKLGIGEIFAGKSSDLLGIAHGDDVLLLYLVQAAKTNLSATELLMQSKLLDMYVSYAYHGVPKFGEIELEKNELDDSIKYLMINGPEDAHTGTYDNIGNHKFWSIIPFNES